jgi:hypothetical protein
MSHRRAPLLLATALAGILAAAPATAAPFPARIDLPAGFMPEGITSGPGLTVYVGSLAGGAIWRGSLRTGEGDTFVEATGEVAVGTEYEAGANRLWVAGGALGEVRVYDASSGSLLADYQFEPGFLNDLVVTETAVYVTDSFNGWLDVIPMGPEGQLPPDDATTTLRVTGITFGPGFNLNGIVEIDGWLVVVKSATGELFRIDPATGTASEIVTDGFDVTTGDGLETNGAMLYVVRNGANPARVAVLDPAADLSSAVLVGEIFSDGFDVPTTATFAAGRLWVVNARFGTQDPQPAPYWITQVSPRP